MTWVAAAVVGGAVIGGVASNMAASKQASASNKATASQAAIAGQQMDISQAQYNKNLELSAPFREAGLTSQNRLMALLGMQAPVSFGPSNPWQEGAYLAANPDVAAAIKRGEFANGMEHYNQYGRTEGRNLGFSPTSATAAGAAAPADFGKYATAEFGGVAGFDPASLMKNFSASDFQVDPGYAFRLSEGMKALDRTAASRGGLLSGSTLKGAEAYNQGLASQEYQNAFNRYQANRATQGQEYANAFNRYQTERTNTLAPLQSLTGVGQTGAAQAQQASNAYTADVNNALGAYGAASSANTINAANARASGYMGTANALSSALGQGINYYQNQQLMNRMFPTTTTA